jgi:hypothetical protein
MADVADSGSGQGLGIDSGSEGSGVGNWGLWEPPSIARVRDHWLGGKDNFGADRAAADAVSALAPWVGTGARVCRSFLRRAVTIMAEAGVDQFVDVGCGLPVGKENTHQIAHLVNPAARVLYVDDDRSVLAHARARLQTRPRVTGAVFGDARQMAEILSDLASGADPHVPRLDFTRPIGVLMVGVLEHLTNPEADAAVTAVSTTCPPGSYLAIAQTTADPAVFANVQKAGAVYAALAARSADTKPKRASNAGAAGEAVQDVDAQGWHRGTLAAAEVYRTLVGPMQPRTWQEIRSFFDGYEVINPGVVGVDLWRSPQTRPAVPSPIVAGVGRLGDDASDHLVGGDAQGP